MLRLFLKAPTKTFLPSKPLSNPKPSRHFATEATFQTQPYRLHNLDQSPSKEITLKKSDALTLFERMTTIRRMEASINNLYKAKIVRGFCHLYAGQEAVAVGIHFNLNPEKDSVITSYRNHAWAFLAYNFSPDEIIAELTGRSTGSGRGKGGSMHIYGKNFYAGSAIVGAQVPMGVGMALAYKYTNSGGVSVPVYGDGASNNGQVFEAFNMAKLWNLPCIFLCENNLYSMGTSVARSTADPDFYKKGLVIPGIWIDGMDVISVMEGARFAHAHCTTGKGPIVIEAQTYRYFGHSLSDPGTSYRTHDEVQEMRRTKDPIKNFKAKILAANLVTEAELQEISRKAKKIVDEATTKAKSDKEIGVEELTYDMYANDVMIKEVRGVTPFKKLAHKKTGRPGVKK